MSPSHRFSHARRTAAAATRRTAAAALAVAAVSTATAAWIRSDAPPRRGVVRLAAAASAPAVPVVPVAVVQPTGPRPVGANGVAAFGDAPFAGNPGPSGAPVVAVRATPSGRGYWTAAADGSVAAFGDASVMGSTVGGAAGGAGGSAGGAGRAVVGMAATPDGHGYWLVAGDGGVFTFGDAPFLGSAGGLRLAQPIVGMAATPDGHGYWMVAADGGVFSFGDAGFLGSAGGLRLAQRIVGMAATPDGRGYWMVAAGGGVYAFGSAPFLGTAAADPNGAPVVGLAPTPDGRGYWLAAGRATRAPLGTFVATCYTGGGTTASGAPTSAAVVAVDPRVIPLGTKLWISGIGERTALDTGGAIRGQRIDVWQPSYGQCIQFGAQPVDVYVQR